VGCEDSADHVGIGGGEASRAGEVVGLEEDEATYGIAVFAEQGAGMGNLARGRESFQALEMGRAVCLAQRRANLAVATDEYVQGH